MVDVADVEARRARLNRHRKGPEVVSRRARRAVVIDDGHDRQRRAAGVANLVGPGHSAADGHLDTRARIGVHAVDRLDDLHTRDHRHAEVETATGRVEHVLGSALRITLHAADVARLRVTRAAVLVVPVGVVLIDEAELAVRLGDRRVGAFLRAQVLDEEFRRRAQQPVHGGGTEGPEGHDEAVELAGPVEQAVVARVGHQHVEAGAAIGVVAVGEQRGIGAVVQATVGVHVVVGVDVVVAATAEHAVGAGAAHQPVVAGVAEDRVAAVVALDRRAGHQDLRAGALVDAVGVEVEQEARNLGARVVGIIGRELARHRVVTERVGRVVAQRGQSLRRLGIELALRLRAGDGVVTGTAVQEIAAQAAVDDVGPAEIERRQVDDLVDVARDVDHRADERAVDLEQGLRAGDEHAVQRLGEPVAAGADLAVVAQDAVASGTAVQAVVATAAVDVVVLAFSERDIVAGHAVDRVVTGLSMQQVVFSAIARPACTLRVVEQHVGTRDDLLARRGVVVVEAEEAGRAGRLPIDADELEDVAVVAEDHVRVARLAVHRHGAIVRLGADVVACNARAGTAEDRVRSSRTHRRCDEAEAVGAVADEVVLAQVAEDQVVAAIAFDVVVAVPADAGEVFHRHPGRARVDRDAPGLVNHRAVALDHVLAHLAEDDVVAGAAGNVVVAERGRVGVVVVVVQAHEALHHAVGVELRSAGDQRVAVAVVDDSARQRTHAQVVSATGAQEVGVVAGDQIVTRATVDQIVAVLATQRVDRAAVAGCQVADMAADDVVVVLATQDAVAALAADQDVLAVVAADQVGAATVGVLGIDRGPGERMHRAHVGGRDQRGVERHVQRQQRKVDPLFAAELVLGLDLAVVAEDQVVAGIATEGVARRAAEDDVVAEAGNDRVGTAVVRCHRADDVDVARIEVAKGRRRITLLEHVVDEAVVAQHDVLAGRAVDHVARHAADDDVVVAAGADVVGTTDGGADALDQADSELMHRVLAGQIARRCGDLAAVAEDDVLAVAGHDRVGAEPRDHDVLAVAGGDLVVAAHAGGDRHHEVDVVRARRVAGVDARALVDQVVDLPVVAEDDVVAIDRRRTAAAAEGVDDVVRTAAEDHVAADAGDDRVIAVAELVARAVDQARIDRHDQAQHLHLIVVVGLAGIA